MIQKDASYDAIDSVVLQLNSPFYFYSYKLNLEKELMTIMGIDNIGFVKRERENNDEINANNEEIDNGGDCFLDEMKKFTKGVSEILGYDLDVEEKQPRVEFVEQGIENQEGEQNNED